MHAGRAALDLELQTRRPPRPAVIEMPRRSSQLSVLTPIRVRCHRVLEPYTESSRPVRDPPGVPLLGPVPTTVALYPGERPARITSGTPETRNM